MGWIDLLGLGLVCATVLACFLVRTGHGADVEDLSQALADAEETIDTLEKQVKDLRDVSANHATALAGVQRTITSTALKSMGRV